MIRSITVILSALSLTACVSTVIEEAESQNYAPVYPQMAFAEEPNLMPTGGIYQGGKGGLFVMDRRASEVGDIITVELMEQFAASKSQGASSSRSDSFNVTAPIPIPIPIFNEVTASGGGDRTFSGSGQATQSNSLTGRMSVSVVRILPGGNLEILGQKKLTLNNGDEYIRLRGVVRPADISANNTVSSDRIAHAEIKYIGAGQIADAGKQGWMSQAVTAVSPF